jgi:hypothetical protein
MPGCNLMSSPARVERGQQVVKGCWGLDRRAVDEEGWSSVDSAVVRSVGRLLDVRRVAARLQAGVERVAIEAETSGDLFQVGDREIADVMLRYLGFEDPVMKGPEMLLVGRALRGFRGP